MARIVLTTFGSYGDVLPSIVLALVMQARGHEALVAAPAHYRTAVEGAGIGFAAVGPDVDFGDDVTFRRVMEPRRGTEFVVREIVLPVLRDTYRELEAACDGADLLVSHTLTYAAPILAESRGMPWVSGVLSPMVFCSAHDPPALAPIPSLARLRHLGPATTALVLRLLKKASSSWSRPIRALRDELGLPGDADPLWEGQHSPHGVVALFSSTIAEPQPDWPANTTLCGFPFHDDDFGGDPEASRVGEFLDSGPPPIVFSLGSSSAQAAGDFFRLALDGTRRVGHRAVLVLGDSPSPALDDDALAVRSTALPKLFRTAAAIVHAGGIGSTGQALRSGRPQLVVPFAHDQFDNAARVARLGYGVAVPKRRLTTRRMTQALEHLLSDASTRARAEEAGRHVEGEHGADRACDVIERAVGG